MPPSNPSVSHSHSLLNKLTLSAALAAALLSHATLLLVQHLAVLNPPGTLSPEQIERELLERRSVAFTLHYNGDGVSPGVNVTRRLGDDVDDVISPLCCEISNVPAERCAPNSGAKLFTSDGVRVLNLAQVADGQRVYCVPQGVHFVWPLVRVGNRVVPRNVKGPIPGKPIVLTQLSNSPRVFSVENFVSPGEIEELFRRNRDRMTPSEVGYGGWQDDTRTSSTSWDDDTEASESITRRTFDILGVDFDEDMHDPLQVLRYTKDGHNGRGQWYKPHVDWFDLDDYTNADPTKNNGTNRFATMFIYMTDVEEGGGTVFPLSTTHLEFDGNPCVHNGTEETPGYIDTKEAHFCCNASSSALKSRPRQGNAVLFYSQGPDGTLDKFSLHGGCPPISDEKWSGNIWVWNRPHPPDEEKQKDLEKHQKMIEEGEFKAVFMNDAEAGHPIEIYFDSKTSGALLPSLDVIQKSFDADQGGDNNEDESGKEDNPKKKKKKTTRFSRLFVIEPGAKMLVNTYPTHVFVGKDTVTGKIVFARKLKGLHDEDDEVEMDGEAMVVRLG